MELVGEVRKCPTSSIFASHCLTRCLIDWSSGCGVEGCLVVKGKRQVVGCFDISLYNSGNRVDCSHNLHVLHQTLKSSLIVVVAMGKSVAQMASEMRQIVERRVMLGQDLQPGRTHEIEAYQGCHY